MPDTPQSPDPEQEARDQALREAEHIIAAGNRNIPDWEAVEPLLGLLQQSKATIGSPEPAAAREPEQERCEFCRQWFLLAELVWCGEVAGHRSGRPWHLCKLCRKRAQEYMDAGDEEALMALIDGKPSARDQTPRSDREAFEHRVWPAPGAQQEHEVEGIRALAKELARELAAAESEPVQAVGPENRPTGGAPTGKHAKRDAEIRRLARDEGLNDTEITEYIAQQFPDEKIERDRVRQIRRDRPKKIRK